MRDEARKFNDAPARARHIEEEMDAVRSKLEENLETLQHRVRRSAPVLGIAGLVVLGLVGGGLAIRAARHGGGRHRRLHLDKLHLDKLLSSVSHLAGEPQRLAWSGRSLRQRAVWAVAAMAASVAARRFARNALVP